MFFLSSEVQISFQRLSPPFIYLFFSVFESWCHQFLPIFSATFCSWSKKVSIWIFNPSGIYLFFFSTCENGIPSSFSVGLLSGPAPFARTSFLFSLFAGPRWSQFKFSHASVSGFSATLLGFIRLFLCQDHTSRFLELYKFMIYLVRQTPNTQTHVHPILL